MSEMRLRAHQIFPIRDRAINMNFGEAFRGLADLDRRIYPIGSAELAIGGDYNMLSLLDAADVKRIRLYPADGRIFCLSADGVERLELDSSYKRRIKLTMGTWGGQNYDPYDARFLIHNWTSDSGLSGYRESAFAVTDFVKSGAGTVDMFAIAEATFYSAQPHEFGMFIGKVHGRGTGNLWGAHYHIVRHVDGAGGTIDVGSQVDMERRASGGAMYGFVASSPGTLDAQVAFMIPTGAKWERAFAMPDSMKIYLNHEGSCWMRSWGGSFHLLASNDDEVSLAVGADYMRIPRGGADPSVENGRIYFNTVTSTFRVCQGGVWRTMTTA